MCIAFRGPVHPWRFDHLPCLSFSPVPSENGNQPTSTWVQWITRRTNRFLPLVGTYTSWGAAFGRWPWQSLILWEGGEAFEETLRCILVHSCHASRPRANRWKTMDGISCRKTDVCAYFLCIRILWGMYQIFKFAIIFQFSYEIPILSARLLPGFVAYEKLEILKKNFTEPQSNFTECGKKFLMKSLQNMNKKCTGVSDCLSFCYGAARFPMVGWML